jgi:hypothetical protein
VSAVQTSQLDHMKSAAFRLCLKEYYIRQSKCIYGIGMGICNRKDGRMLGIQYLVADDETIANTSAEERRESEKGSSNLAMMN